MHQQEKRSRNFKGRSCRSKFIKLIINSYPNVSSLWNQLINIQYEGVYTLNFPKQMK